ncbi:hypothetical protein N431DRAFT_225705 [Stipitochalara longipes BDJ]|nr:hypothetical protein N431DRAFT_225705 [Stipitochalara longipes BDJ]
MDGGNTYLVGNVLNLPGEYSFDAIFIKTRICLQDMVDREFSLVHSDGMSPGAAILCMSEFVGLVELVETTKEHVDVGELLPEGQELSLAMHHLERVIEFTDVECINIHATVLPSHRELHLGRRQLHEVVVVVGLAFAVGIVIHREVDVVCWRRCSHCRIANVLLVERQCRSTIGSTKVVHGVWTSVVFDGRRVGKLSEAVQGKSEPRQNTR